MSKNEELHKLYTSTKHLIIGGLISTAVLLTGSAWCFYRDVPAMGYTFGVCSLMFLALSAVGCSILITARRNMSK